MAAMPRLGMTLGFAAASALLLALVLVIGVLVLRQDRLLYFPTRSLGAAPAASASMRPSSRS